jgi:hypothetical protein
MKKLANRFFEINHKIEHIHGLIKSDNPKSPILFGVYLVVTIFEMKGLDI